MIIVTGFEKSHLSSISVEIHDFNYLNFVAISWEGKQIVACNLPRFYSYS